MNKKLLFIIKKLITQTQQFADTVNKLKWCNRRQESNEIYRQP